MMKEDQELWKQKEEIQQACFAESANISEMVILRKRKRRVCSIKNRQKEQRVERPSVVKGKGRFGESSHGNQIIGVV